VNNFFSTAWLCDDLLGVNECDSSHVDSFLFVQILVGFMQSLVGSVLFKKKIKLFCTFSFPFYVFGLEERQDLLCIQEFCNSLSPLESVGLCQGLCFGVGRDTNYFVIYV